MKCWGISTRMCGSSRGSDANYVIRPAIVQTVIERATHFRTFFNAERRIGVIHRSAGSLEKDISSAKIKLCSKMAQVMLKKLMRIPIGGQNKNITTKEINIKNDDEFRSL